jgi:hypothetical protein
MKLRNRPTAHADRRAEQIAMQLAPLYDEYNDARQQLHNENYNPRSSLWQTCSRLHNDIVELEQEQTQIQRTIRRLMAQWSQWRDMPLEEFERIMIDGRPIKCSFLDGKEITVKVNAVYTAKNARQEDVIHRPSFMDLRWRIRKDIGIDNDRFVLLDPSTGEKLEEELADIPDDLTAVFVFIE